MNTKPFNLEARISAPSQKLRGRFALGYNFHHLRKCLTKVEDLNRFSRINLLLVLKIFFLLSASIVQADSFITSSPNASIPKQMATPLKLVPGKDLFNITKHLTVIADNEQNLQPKDLIPLFQNQSDLVFEEPVITRIEGSTYWMALSIDAKDLPEKSLNAPWLLEFQNTPNYEVSVYTTSNQTVTSVSHASTYDDFDTRQYQHPNLLVPLQLLGSEQQDVLIRFKSRAAIQLQAFLVTEKGLLDHNRQSIFAWGTFYGVILIVLAHNMLAYLLLQDRPSVYYILTVLSFALLFSSLNGWAYYLLWPGLPRANDYIITLAFGFMLHFAWKFISSYLRVEPQTKPQQIALWLFSLCPLILTGAALLTGDNYLALGFPYVILFLMVVLGFCLHGIYRKKEHAFTVLLVGCVYFLGMGSSMLVFFDLLPSNLYTFHAKEVGALAAMLILSLGLSNRINKERKIKEKTQIAIDNKSASIRFFSHEIRTPLNAIVKFSELALRGNRADTQHYDDLQEIENASKAMLSLVNDIIDVEQIEEGTVSLVQVPFTLAEVINASFSMIKPTALEKGLDLRKPPNNELVNRVLVGDPARLRQIFVNLLANAVKFTERGEISLSFNVIGQTGTTLDFEFIISDTGIGIEKEKIKHLFSPFVQADTSTARKFGGSGLGLKISRELLALMNGDIWVESQTGRGTKFHLRVPLLKTPEEARVLDSNNGMVEHTSPPAPTYSKSGIDLQYAIHNLKWNRAMLTAHLTGFIKTYQHFRQEIQEYFEADKFSDLQRTTHTLKSAAIGLGARQLSHLSEQAQRSAENNTLTQNQLTQLILELEKVYSAVSKELNKRGRNVIAGKQVDSAQARKQSKANQQQPHTNTAIALLHLEHLQKLLEQHSGQCRAYFNECKEHLVTAPPTSSSRDSQTEMLTKLENHLVNYQFSSALDVTEKFKALLPEDEFSEHA